MIAGIFGANLSSFIMSTLFAPVRIAVSFPKSLFPCSVARVWHLSSPFRCNARRGNEFTLNSMSMSVESEASSSSKEDDAVVVENADVVIQYVVLRRDLIDTWPLGSVVTQGCHASVAAIWSHKDDPHTTHYCSPENIDSMHKVTLEVKGATQILNLSEKLTAGGIPHKLWIEQPENIPTCLATKPHPKSKVLPFFRKLKLCK